MQATVTLVHGMQFVGEGSSGHAIVMDADSTFGGTDTGVRPTELLLLGLGGCSGMDVISILRKKRQEITGLEIALRGTRVESHPKKFTDIEIIFRIRGRNISEDAVKRAVELSMDKYCSVKASLEGPAKIAFSYEIQQDAV